MIFNINNPTDVQIVKTGIYPMGERIGITSGCYDLLHNFHLLYLQRCRRLCDVLIVGVDGDERVRNLKGKNRPIVPEHNRVAMVDALKVVHAAFIMDNLEDLEYAISILGANFIFRNQEWASKKGDVVGTKDAELIIVPDVLQVDSTSRIIEEIQKRI